MEKKTTVNVIVHVNDETVTSASRVPSTDQDFVSMKIGPDVSVLLFTPAHAKAVADAAVTAFGLLKTIEAESEINNIWGDGTVTESEYNSWIQDAYSDEVEFDYADYSCTIERPCNLCSEGYLDYEVNEDPVYYDFEDDNDRF